MSQPFEDPLRDPSASSSSKTARILPFERPPTDLQRAVQTRAQEAIERERERSRTKPAPLRWAVIFLLALVPVLLIFAGVDAFVRAFHRINETYSNMPAPAAPESAEQAAPPPAVIQQEPGVVILQPMNESQDPPPADPKAPASE
jgi:hypothetical protein